MTHRTGVVPAERPGFTSTRGRGALWLGIVGLLVVVGLALAAVHGLVGPAAEAVRVIRVGQEARILESLREPLYARSDFAGHRPTDVRVERDSLRIVLEASSSERTPPTAACRGEITIRHADSGPIGAADPRTAGAVVGELAVAARGCLEGESARDALAIATVSLARALAGGPLPSVFEPAEPTARRGLLGPCASSLGLSARALLDGALLIALALGLFGAWLHSPISAAPPIPPDAEPLRSGTSRHRALLVGTVGVALLARLALACAMPFDVDETWARADATPVLADHHDAWVHPPLGRAFALASASEHEPRTSAERLRMRLPFVALGTLGIVVFSLVLRTRVGAARRAPERWALGLVAFAGSTLEASSLARPYALVQLAFAVLVVSVMVRESPRLARFAGMLATVVACFADVVGGAIASALFVRGLVRADVAAASDPWRRFRGAASLSLSAAAVAVPWLALAPGIRVAFGSQLAPHDGSVGRGPDLRPESRGWSELLGAVPSTFSPGMASSALGLIVLGLCMRHLCVRGGKPVARFVLAVLLACAALGFLVALRPRNLAFLPWLLALALAAKDTWPESPVVPANPDGMQRTRRGPDSAPSLEESEAVPA